MSTLKANKDKARFISNTISQDALDGDWVDHEVITKYKLPEIVLDASTSTVYPNNDGIVSPTEITTGDKIKVLDGANMVERTAGTVTTTGGFEPDGSLNASTTDIVPAMTSNIQNGFTLTVSNDFANGLAPYQAFDNLSDNNCWATQDGRVAGEWFKIQMASSTCINKYTLRSKGTSENTAMLKDWTFQGSNDGTNFTNLDVRTGFTYAINEVKTFSFSNSTAYPYYRFLVQATNGTTYIRLGEIELIEAIGTQTKYQAPLEDGIGGSLPTSLPSTKAFFNKTIDTTLSAEATGKCKSSTITQIGVL